jgi:hypothetical protein
VSIFKYVRYEPQEFLFGQDARTKEWYCKELRANTIKEADKKMNEANKLCNKYNKTNKSEKEKTVRKTPGRPKKTNIKQLS